jgi:hypothetical protein
MARTVLEKPSIDQMVAGWRFVLNEQAFFIAIRHRAAIDSALTDSEARGLRGVARLLLEVATALGVSLGDWEALLTQIAAGRTDGP